MAKNNDQIWNALMEIKEDLGEVKGEQQASRIHLHNIDQHLNRLNERTGKTENKVAKIIGMGMGIAFVLSLAVALSHVF